MDSYVEEVVGHVFKRLKPHQTAGYWGVTGSGNTSIVYCILKHKHDLYFNLCILLCVVGMYINIDKLDNHS